MRLLMIDCSRKYHPDKNKDPGAEEKFVEIAHGTLLLEPSFIHHLIPL